jgi:hypothetical protein
MRGLILVVMAGCAHAATLTISPAQIFDCQSGAAVAEISWSDASGPVSVRLDAPDGTAVTGFGDPSGSITAAGPWVTDGMKFLLVNQAGGVEATAVAHVSCGSTVRTVDTGLQGGSYFPLQVGNTWVYRVNSRVQTRYFVTRTITGTETINGKTYFDLLQTFAQGDTALIAKLRGDNNGVIWMATPDGEQVYLSNGEPTSYTGPIGSFSDAVKVSAIGPTTSVYARGIGLVHYDSSIMAGSSGGFDESLELIEVRMTGLQIAAPAAKISVSVESTDLDITDQLAPNCALPCYFSACGVGGFPPDAPGVYRPCTQARIEATGDPGAEIRLELQDAKGTVLFTDSRIADASGRDLRYVRAPLYTTSSPVVSTPFSLLPAGEYRVVGRVLEGGQEVASSNINVRVR